jgi:hypothetical protein
VPERTRDRGLLEAAVDLAQCSYGFDDHGAGRTGFELKLHAEHASSSRSVDEPATGLVHQRLHDAPPSG